MPETEVTSKRITLFNKESYKVDLEYNDNFAIIHLPSVTKITKEVYMDMRQQLKDLITFVGDMGYDSLWAAIEPSNTVVNKAALKFGFVFKGQADGYNVYQIGNK